MTCDPKVGERREWQTVGWFLEIECQMRRNGMKRKLKRNSWKTIIKACDSRIHVTSRKIPRNGSLLTSWLTIVPSFYSVSLRQFHDKAFDESKNRSMTSVSTLQELGSQMMEFYNDSMQGHMIPRDKTTTATIKHSQESIESSYDCW